MKTLTYIRSQHDIIKIISDWLSIVVNKNNVIILLMLFTGCLLLSGERLS